MSMTAEEREIFNSAIKKWGRADQIEMLVEECSEVILAIQKMKRKITPASLSQGFVSLHGFSNVHEELADLGIMLDQMRLIFNPAQIQDWREKKINRLKNRIDAHSQEV